MENQLGRCSGHVTGVALGNCPRGGGRQFWMRFESGSGAGDADGQAGASWTKHVTAATMGRAARGARDSGGDRGAVRMWDGLLSADRFAHYS